MGTLKVNNIQSVTDGSVTFPQGSISSQPVTFPSGTASNPSISFTGDTDTGLYRIDANKIGISTGGSKVGEIGSGYGGFTGNVIQLSQSTNTYKQIITSTSYVDLLSAVGIIWEIPFTPKYSSSKILIVYSIQGELFLASNTQYMGIGISKKISSGSYSQIFDPGERQFGIAVGNSTSVYTTNQFTYFYLDDSNTTNLINYKLQCKLYNSNSSGSFYFNMSVTGNYVSTVTLMEIQQ